MSVSVAAVPAAEPPGSDETFSEAHHLNIGVSAPGKAILMGEHAAVYGRPALVAAIDRRMHLRLAARPKPAPVSVAGLRLQLPQVGVDDRWPWSRFIDYASDRREAWQAWAADPSQVAFDTVLGSDPAHLVRVAVGETLIHLGVEPELEAHIEMVSEIPLGSGFGSSAAASVAVVRAILELQGATSSADVLHRLSLEAERRQHGAPSGVDNATVIYGGALWVEKTGVEKTGVEKTGVEKTGVEKTGVEKTADRISMEPLEISNCELIDRLRIYHSGTPAEATGEVVAAVRALRESDPPGFDAELDRASALTAELRRLLQLDSCDPEQPLALIQQFGSWLEAQGVVPESVATIVRQVEAAGGAAKISGAGALTGPGAGSLLMFHPNPDKLDGIAALEDLERIDVRFGASGVRLEPTEAPTKGKTA